MPRHAVIQFAGDIGFISAGIGYTSRNKKFNGEILYGYVPKVVGGIAIHSVSGKFTWSPVKWVYHKLIINYFTAGIFVNYTFGHQYFGFSPPFYPYHYYGFPIAFHEGLFIGGAVGKNKMSLYYELGTNEKEFLSYIGNTKSLSLTDIIHLGLGARIQLK